MLPDNALFSRPKSLVRGGRAPRRRRSRTPGHESRRPPRDAPDHQDSNRRSGGKPGRVSPINSTIHGRGPFGYMTMTLFLFLSSARVTWGKSVMGSNAYRRAAPDAVKPENGSRPPGCRSPFPTDYRGKSRGPGAMELILSKVNVGLPPPRRSCNPGRHPGINSALKAGVSAIAGKPG